MWNAEIYNRYGKERIQPSVDLVARIKDMKFQRILYVGCGTGMSTESLVLAWKSAEIIGVDLSKEMLKKAREILRQLHLYKEIAVNRFSIWEHLI